MVGSTGLEAMGLAPPWHWPLVEAAALEGTAAVCQVLASVRQGKGAGALGKGMQLETVVKPASVIGVHTAPMGTKD